MVNDNDFMDISDIVMMGLFKQAKLYRMIKDGTFPPPFKIGSRSYWNSSDIESWKNAVRSRLSADAMRKHVKSIVESRKVLDL